MRAYRYDGREDQARRIHIGTADLAMQVRLGFGARVEQPQYAARHRREEPHPEGEDLGQDLVGSVEAAEHEAVVGQAAGRARGRRTGRQPGGVAGVERVRHVQRLLGVEPLQMLRQAEAVGENVVVPFGAERARKADAVDLQRRRPERKDAHARVEGVAHAIDENGDAVVANVLRDLRD